MKHIRHFLLTVAIRLLYWLMFKKGTQLKPVHLLAAGWTDHNDGFFTEPNIKVRDKVTIQFEHHYYRVFHGEDLTFVALESSLEWLQVYLFTLDKHRHTDTRRELVFQKPLP